MLVTPGRGNGKRGGIGWVAVGAEVAFGMLREGEGEGLFIHVCSFLSILTWLVFSVCKSIWNHNFLTQTLN